MLISRHLTWALGCLLLISGNSLKAAEGPKIYQACYEKTYKSCMAPPAAPIKSIGTSRQDIVNYIQSTAKSDPSTEKIYAHLDCQKKAETECNQLAYKAETKDPINKKCLETVMSDPTFHQKNARLFQDWNAMSSIWLKAASEPLFSACVDLAVHDHKANIQAKRRQQVEDSNGGSESQPKPVVRSAGRPKVTPPAPVISARPATVGTKVSDDLSLALEACHDSDWEQDAIDECIAESRAQFANSSANSNKAEAVKALEKPGPQMGAPAAASAGQGATCQDAATLQQLEDQCRAQTQDAASTCNDNTDPGLSNAATLGDQLAAGLQGVASTVGACTQVAQYGTALNGAMATYNQNCVSKHQLCVQSCQKFKSALAASKCTSDQLAEFEAASGSYPEICIAMKVKSDVVAAQGQATISGIQQATNCAVSTSATAMNLTDCQANPTAPNCVAASTDCSNPQVAATSAVCACSADPMSAACRKLSGTAGSASSASLSNFTGSGGATVSSSASSSSLSLGNDPVTQTPINVKPGDTKLNPGGGAGGMAGGGFGGIGKGKSGAGDPPTGRASSRLSADILGGTRNGGSSAGGARTFGSNPSDGAKVYDGLQKGGGANLRNFLPGGAFDPKRGLAGVAGPDGMTGPHSDLFGKVANRYRIIEPTLLP